MPRTSAKNRNVEVKPVEEERKETIINDEVKTNKEESNVPSAPVFTMEQVQKMIEEAIANSKSQEQKKSMTAITADEFVTMVFQAEVNDSNVIMLGPNGKFGQITGKKATITIPKRDFMGEFRTATIQSLLASRNLIVIDGLTDEERNIYGLNYQKGEYLEQDVYEGLINMGDDILNIYPKLHPSWRLMVAVKFADAFENKTLKVSRETLVKLNKISKKDFADLPKDDERRKGAFWQIISAMNAAEESDEEE